ncbi:MAG: thiamine-phosphate kinase [Pseudomonadales bacterium]|nr:thiamine-phosphate kinase [Pseudomonadales bacterium]
MDEFDLIDRIVATLGPVASGKSVVLGPGDDCAQMGMPPNFDLVSSIDTLIEGRHFPDYAGGDLVGYRSIVVNLSDLAAMGARPSHALMALSIPQVDLAWVDAFCIGVRAACTRYGCPMVGGNIARGPLSISVSIHGLVKKNTGLRRTGADAGDLLCVTGRVGGAFAAMENPRFQDSWTLEKLLSASLHTDNLPIQHYYAPQPRLEFGQRLIGIATAAIDVSDGLLADATHIAKASGVGLKIQLSRIPNAVHCTVEQALVAGDDYELCFTVPQNKLEIVQTVANELEIAVQVIGQCDGSNEVKLYQDEKSPLPVNIDTSGYRHF